MRERLSRSQQLAQQVREQLDPQGQGQQDGAGGQRGQRASQSRGQSPGEQTGSQTRGQANNGNTGQARGGQEGDGMPQQAWQGPQFGDAALWGNARSVSEEISQQSIESFLNQPELLESILQPLVELESQLRAAAELSAVSQRLFNVSEEDIAVESSTLRDDDIADVTFFACPDVAATIPVSFCCQCIHGPPQIGTWWEGSHGQGTTNDTSAILSMDKAPYVIFSVVAEASPNVFNLIGRKFGQVLVRDVRTSRA
jgi:hypothetical protein